jgi:23S rRNA pseudouridine1911/1915/1917 synthase
MNFLGGPAPKWHLSLRAANLMEEDRVSHFKHVGPPYVGQTLVSFLSARFKYFDSAEWTRLIQVGDVLLNEEPTEAERLLKSGDKVCYRAMMRAEPPVPTQISVLFEDEDLLIVNKPAHIPVHPTGRYLRNTLINVLKSQRKLKTIFLSHRLDRETSGVCVLVKTTLAKDKMYWQFFNNECDKTYWGLVWGRPNPLSGIIDEPIGNSRPEQSKIRIKQMVRGLDSKTAKTKFHTLGTKWVNDPKWAPPAWQALEALKKGDSWESPWPVSLVECKPVTGRTNQIRVHLAHLGAGIVGDKLYDPDEGIFMAFKSQNFEDKRAIKGSFINLDAELRKRLVLDAHALHARSLGFRHPRSGKMMTVEAPPPRSWQGLYDPPKGRR